MHASTNEAAISCVSLGFNWGHVHSRPAHHFLRHCLALHSHHLPEGRAFAAPWSPFDILRMKKIGFISVIHIRVDYALRFQTGEVPQRSHCNLVGLLALYGSSNHGWFDTQAFGGHLISRGHVTSHIPIQY